MSVRKRAIKSLWDCCTCPGFSRATEAVVAVLQRAGDAEDSMRGLVTKICGEMWFTEGSSFAGEDRAAAAAARQQRRATAHGHLQVGSTALGWCTSDAAAASRAGLSDGAAASDGAPSRTAELRARELAAVALRVYEARGRGIHVPLPPDHALVVILQEVLGLGSSGGAGGAAAAVAPAAAKQLAHVRHGAGEVAGALLSLALQAQQQVRAARGCNTQLCKPCLAWQAAAGGVGLLVQCADVRAVRWRACCLLQDGPVDDDDEEACSPGPHSTAAAPAGSGGGGGGAFPFLLALHALCIADASLAAPASDPQRFVRCLAPYVGAAAAAAGGAGGGQPSALSRTISRTSSSEHRMKGVPASMSALAAAAAAWLLATACRQHLLCCCSCICTRHWHKHQRRCRCVVCTCAAMTGAGLPDDASRRAAEECLCLLGVLEALMCQLGLAEAEVLQQLSSDLLAMAGSQRLPQVRSGESEAARPPARPCWCSAVLCACMCCCRQSVISLLTSSLCLAAAAAAVRLFAADCGWLPRAVRAGAAVPTGGAARGAARHEMLQHRPGSAQPAAGTGLHSRQPRAHGAGTQVCVRAAVHAPGRLHIGRLTLLLLPLLAGCCTFWASCAGTALGC